MFDTKAFGALVRYLRMQRGLSQIELAQMMGALDYRVVNNVERGGRLYVGYLFDLCKELGISVEFHITGTHVPAHLAAALATGFDFTEMEDRQLAIILAEVTSTHMAENDMDGELALKKVVSAKEKERRAQHRVRLAKEELRRLRERYADVPGADDEGYRHDAF